MHKRCVRNLTRRHLLAASAAAAAAKFPIPAIAQGATSIKMTLPWLPQGAQLFPFVARNRGFWQRRGLNVEIARGFGSAAAIQTITQRQVQTGIIAAPSILVGAAQGLDTRVVGIDGYDSTMGFLVLADSPIIGGALHRPRPDAFRGRPGQSRPRRAAGERAGNLPHE